MLIGIDARLWNETGVGRYIRNLIINLQRLDKKNTYLLFVLRKDREHIKSQITNPKFQTVLADIRWHSVDEQMQFSSLLDKHNLDLVHFPYFSVPIFYNRPFVITIHDLILHHFPTGEASHLPYALYRLKLEAYKFIIKHAAGKSEKIITVSEATKKEIIDHLYVPDEKIVVTYEGVDLVAKSKEQRAKSLPRNYFLHVGNVYPHKNTERLLEAFSVFSHTYKQQTADKDEPKLVFVGRDDFFLKRLKEKITSMNLSTSVEFYGEVTDSELSDLYEHALATVVPSLMEGFGLPAIEAMAHHCLVMVSDIPSLREVCGEAAIYCDPFHTESLSEALQNIVSMTSEEKKKKISLGLAKIKNYSWEMMSKKTLEVYESSTRIR